MGTFHVITATSLHEAYYGNEEDGKFQEYVGDDYVSNVVIRIHGRPGGIRADSEDLKSGINAKAIDFYLDPEKTLPDNYNRSVTAFESILGKIEDGGTCLITGCNAGEGKAGKDFAKAAAKLADQALEDKDRVISVYCSQDYCTRFNYNGQIQIWRGANVGLISLDDYEDGFIVSYRDENGDYIVVPLKDESKNIKGNIILDSRVGKKTITIK